MLVVAPTIGTETKELRERKNEREKEKKKRDSDKL
jgi:hypothetical protein